MPTRLSSAIKWQEAWKAGDPRVLPFHGAQAWRWETGVENRDASGTGALTPEALAEWHGILAESSVPTPIAVTDQLNRLADPRALVVVSGQQAGVGLGPVYTIYKALAARHWAQKIEAETGRPCVPVFWIASDDHDLAEVRNLTWQSKDAKTLHSDLVGSDESNRRSVWRVPLEAERCRAFMAEFIAATNETEFRPEVMRLLEAAFKGANVESQFTRLFLSLLGPLGIVPLAPRLAFVRRGATTLFLKELTHWRETNESVKSVGQQIGELGMTPPLHRSGREVNLFIDWEEARCRIVAADDEGSQFHILEPGESRKPVSTLSRESLEILLKSEPERFSPNAIMRPLVQDTILPSVVYIAGPTEFVYHGQLGNLYSQFSVARPAVFPRPNVFLMERKTERAMEKLGVGADILKDGNADSIGSASTVKNDPRAEELSRHIAGVEEKMTELQAFISGLNRDTAVQKAMEKVQAGTSTGLKILNERVVAWLNQQDEDRNAARLRLREAMFPADIPQERSIGILSPFLVNYGIGLIPRLQAGIDFNANGFQTIKVD